MLCWEDADKFYFSDKGFKKPSFSLAVFWYTMMQRFYLREIQGCLVAPLTL